MLRQQGFDASGDDGGIDAGLLGQVTGIDAVMAQAPQATLLAYRAALAEREGKLIPLICEEDNFGRLVVERHLCIDTTAAGGNASLIAAVS